MRWQLQYCCAMGLAFLCYPLLLLGSFSACPPSPSWNLPSFTVESTLFFPCSRYDSPLAHLDSPSSHDLVIWTDGSVPFSFGKSGSGVLANCSLCGTEATLSFSADPVCTSFSVEGCVILQALCWSKQYRQAYHFSFLLLLSDSRSVLSPVFPFTSNSLGGGGSPNTRFSRGGRWLMSWPDEERY